MVKFLKWFFSRHSDENIRNTDGVHRLENTMKITSISRYNASSRLKMLSKISFITTTILSLGLIFMPLMQMANISLAFSSNILSAIQIFLAVSVLVYSVIIGTARYDLRSEQLTECGDKIKSLIRELRADNGKIVEIQNQYSNISTAVENHARNDFLLSTLRTSELYKITGIVRILKWIQFSLYYSTMFIMPLLLLSIEFIFILDMFNVTTFFTPYLKEIKS